MTKDTAYPPLNVPKRLADDLWIVDAQPIVAAGILTLPVRMTIVRLRNGDLLLHSPTQFRSTLKDAIERLGPIRHLVAPSVGHWMFVKEWQDRCPQAHSWGLPQLQRRKQVRDAGLRFDATLRREAPPEWSDVLEQVLVEGGAGYAELNFFHKPSRTLLVCDTILNVEAHRLPFPSDLLARGAGICAPVGKAPTQLRALLLLKRTEASQAARRLIALAPERVIVAHGSVIEHDATAHLQRSLAWLLSSGNDAAKALGAVAAIGVLGATAVVLTRRDHRRLRGR